MKEEKKIGTFILNLIFKGWKNTISIIAIIGVVGFFLVPVMNEAWKLKNSIIIVLCICVFSFIFKIIKQYYLIYMNIEKIPHAIRIINGDGANKGKQIIVFSKEIAVKKNEILTMYCDSSGARQPICLIRVIDYTNNEIITEQYPTQIEKVDKYFAEESRKISTYLLRGIDSVFLENQLLRRK